VSTLTDHLATQLEHDEGLVLHAYPDQFGYQTIGYGRMIDARKGGGITKEEARGLLSNDIARVSSQLDVALPWFRALNEARQGVLLNMAFQMGVGSDEPPRGLLGFRMMLDALRDERWFDAAEQMRRSDWAKQTPKRCVRLARQIEVGDWEG
jgi:lysozyme